MSRIPASKRYNARGERLCATCRRYLNVDQFGRRRDPDGLQSSCRVCTCAQRRARWARHNADPETWRRTLDAAAARLRRRSAARKAERGRFVHETVNMLAAKGFTNREIAALAGLDRCTVGRYRQQPPTQMENAIAVKLERLVQATADLPIIGPPKRGDSHRPPHPALGLVRARLARMAYLAELEAAA